MSVLDLIKLSRPTVIPIDLSVGTVFIKEMDGHQFEVMQNATKKDPESGEINTFRDAQLAAMVLCEQDGTPCFPTPDAGVPYLLPMKASDLRKITKAALLSVGIGETKEQEVAREKKS